ncbi:MAG: EamA family transporter [Kurthia sp.]|nr:EamA family transporter [Candidatus Kurthia equi]
MKIVQRSLSYILVLLAAILWGTVGTTQTYLTNGIQPITIAMTRSLLGGGILLILAIIMKKINFKKWSWKQTFFAALAMALFQPLFFTSVNLTGVAVGTVVTIGSSPIFAGLIEWLFFKKNPGRTWLLATVLSIIGCTLLFTASGETIIVPSGIIFALFAGFMFASYTNVSKVLIAKEESLPAVAMTFTICGLILLPISLILGIEWIGQSSNWLPIMTMAFLGTSLAYILFLNGLQKISSSAAVTLSLGEPLTAALLGVFLVGETLSSLAWLGVAMLLGGILVVTFKRKNNPIDKKVIS